MGKESGKRILIADDALPLRIMMEEVLSEAGYQVLTASNGLEALELIKSQGKEIDLLILDLLMPRMSGFDVLSHLKQELPGRRFPILVISGVFKREKEIQKLKELGANGYLSKSSLVDEILYRVNGIFYSAKRGARRYPRVLFSLPADYQFDGVKYTSYTTTLSVGGCFIRTLKPAPKDALVNLWLSIPGCECKEVIHTQAKVVWLNGYYDNYKPNTPPGMGLEFQGLKDRELECIKELVDQKLQEEKLWQDP